MAGSSKDLEYAAEHAKFKAFFKKCYEEMAAMDEDRIAKRRPVYAGVILTNPVSDKCVAGNGSDRGVGVSLAAGAGDFPSHAQEPPRGLELGME
eukprot:gene5729-5969_t